MPTYITVPGASSSVIVNPYNTAYNISVAQAISNALQAALTAGKLDVQTYSPSLAPPPAGYTGELAVTTNSPSTIVPPTGFTFTSIGPSVQGGSTPSGPFTVSGATSLFVGNQQVNYYGSAATGTVSIAAGDGNDVFSLPNGSSYVLGLGNGSDTVFADGSGTVSVGGPGDTGSNLIFASNGPNDINAYGSNDTITAGSGAVTVTTFGTTPTVFGGSGPLTYLGGSSGPVTIVGPTGSVQETLFGGSGTDLTYKDGPVTTPGAAILAAGIGNETLDASSDKYGVYLAEGSGTVTMLGGSGSDTFFGGSGTATMTGGAGNNVFFFGNTGHGGGTVTISDFSSSDLFETANYGNALSSATTVSGGGGTTNTVVTLSDSTKITFLDVTPNQINYKQF